MKTDILTEKHRLGLGGVAIGTAFEALTDGESYEVLQKAWDLGIRYYDTSPWYGLTKSERRFGNFLHGQNRDEFVFSTKVGRLFTPVSENEVPPTMWQDPLSFDFEHNYTADAIKRSIEESLERSRRHLRRAAARATGVHQAACGGDPLLSGASVGATWHHRLGSSQLPLRRVGGRREAQT